ncbi:MAG: hypothetical protein NXH75_15455, partial [Halobacteriovoraceae bacterium]|nr:hypothetical protein [Halobacteriovoraceae bacterium]
MYLISKNSTLSYAKENSGGKGLNLYYLSKAGFPVPKFIVVPPSAYQLFLEENNLTEKLQLLLSSGEKEKIIEETVQKMFLDQDITLDSALGKFIKEAFQKLDAKCLSVRSSALGEDSGSHSFAGQLSSYLYITSLEETIESLKKCWASAYSERSQVYRKQNSLDTQNIQVAVVFQEMIFSEKSGVLFTGNPINKDPNQIIINAVHGVGEGLVGGHLEGDNFVLNKETGELVESEVNPQTEIFTGLADGKGLIKKGYEGKAEDNPSLTNSELKSLYELSKKIEKYYQFPQDVEFAFFKGELFLLQSRPITTEINNG